MIQRLLLALSLVCAAAARADDSFTQSLSPADFKAAGLDKLTPEQLAKLDALVRGEKAGAVAKATEETTQVVTAKVTQAVTAQVTEVVTAQVTQAVTAKVAATVRQQVKAEDQTEEKKKAASASFMERMKVVLKPGTEIEYTTLDAMLVPGFHGWEKGTILTLTNGQRWVVTDDDRYWAPLADKPVHARVVPGIMGSFFMEIEKGGRPRVRFLGNVSPQAPAQPEAPPEK